MSANNYDSLDDLRLCGVCGAYECIAPATVCWRCREQEMIDAEPWLDELPNTNHKDFVCSACNAEYDADDDYCKECGAEIWTWEELEIWQGVEDDE